MKYDVKGKIALLFALLEDSECNDAIVDMLCCQLTNVSEQLWENFKERLEILIEPNNFLFNRNQLLKLANIIENMYAKGYDKTSNLARLIYERVQQTGVEFNPDRRNLNERIQV